MFARLVAGFLGAFSGTPNGQCIDFFLQGMSIPAISARLYPGVGGPQQIASQRAIEDEIRAYIFDLQFALARAEASE